ncbi:uncharacterized protein C8A04DRAFT_10144 [Dichotomopilus funicola]|uniref:NmrA-like domain-containing protein n=1 Tax=Dichotomopilus funicola TaxID=1934379 RepID=A0AAN6V7M0_9PEZI|nr:hypothetical protein C8A04DRAFT_10144 [Dichotomopilus funicola]
MSKILVVLGATGQQGGSVAQFVFSHPDLSTRFRVRGVTRDPRQPAAAALRAKGAEIAQANLDDPESLRTAFIGAHTVFISTVTTYHSETKEREVRQGKAAADAAVAEGAQYIIYSTEVHSEVISEGKLCVPAFDARGEVEAYIRSLPIKSAFVATGSFMQNFAGGGMSPRMVGTKLPGVYTMANMCPRDRRYPWLDVVGDMGKFVGAILVEPDRFEGKRLYAASGMHSFAELAEKLTKHTERKVRYVQITDEQFAGFLPPSARGPVVKMFKFCTEYGYYGPQTESLVEEMRELIPYKLTTLDEFIAANITLA